MIAWVARGVTFLLGVFGLLTAGAVVWAWRHGDLGDDDTPHAVTMIACRALAGAGFIAYAATLSPVAVYVGAGALVLQAILMTVLKRAEQR